MGLIIISVNDCLLWGDKLTDVDGRGVCMLLQVISQFLKVIVQVVSLCNLVDELLLDVRDLILKFLALSLLSVHLSSQIGVLLDLDLNDSESFSAQVFSLLNLRIVEEPLGEEVNWVFRVCLVHDSHAFGNDDSQVLALQIISVCYLFNHS